jgi:small subunit ribosomal protein S16
MVVIRMSRGGSKNRPYHNIVVADSRMPRDGRFIENVGFWNPMAPEGSERIRIALDRVEYWTSKGAKASDSVARLVRQAKKQVAA